MELIPHHVLEWFVVPVLMYLLLFWWRDNLNILHMPLADLVALLVIADVAIVLNYDELPKVLEFLGANPKFAPTSPDLFLLLAALGIGTCRILIYQIEKRILSIAVHHISVGIWHKPSPHYLPRAAAFRRHAWQQFLARWATGFGICAVIISLHLTAVGIYPFATTCPYLARGEGHWLIEAAFSGVAVFAVFLGLGSFLILVGFFRYSPVSLPWTNLPEDQRGKGPAPAGAAASPTGAR